MTYYLVAMTDFSGLVLLAFEDSTKPPDMVRIPGDEFISGTDEEDALRVGWGGFARTSPVMSFLPNGYGFYDWIGNAWEWCAGWFDATRHEKLASDGLCHTPSGPERSFNPHHPHAQQRVSKAGSFLCAENYCANYRPSSRRGTDDDTGMSHLGFRCVLSPNQHD